MISLDELESIQNKKEIKMKEVKEVKEIKEEIKEIKEEIKEEVKEVKKETVFDLSNSKNVLLLYHKLTDQELNEIIVKYKPVKIIKKEQISKYKLSNSDLENKLWEQSSNIIESYKYLLFFYYIYKMFSEVPIDTDYILITTDNQKLNSDDIMNCSNLHIGPYKTMQKYCSVWSSLSHVMKTNNIYITINNVLTDSK